MDKNWITTIQVLLNGRNDEFDAADKKRVRLIRHKDNRKVKIIDGKKYKNSLYDIYLHDNEVFMSYQSEQIKKDFMDVDYIVAFIGEESTTSRFVGVYKNHGAIKDTGLYNNKVLAKFDFRKIDGFESLNEKIVIDWKSPITWCQHYCNEMPVVRIDRGLEENNIPVFTRFEDVMLSYDQLALIFEKKNQEWKSKLESCNCIYLILDKSNGKQYVGSTYNKQGIWGRWASYAETGHGNDVELEELLKADPNYARKNFQWCILETLPLNILNDQAIDRESLYKRKFGTRDFGYNNN